MTTIIIWILSVLLFVAIISIIRLNKYANHADREITGLKVLCDLYFSTLKMMMKEAASYRDKITKHEKNIADLEADIRGYKFINEMQVDTNFELMNENAELNYQLQLIKAIKNHKKRPVKPEPIKPITENIE